MAASDTAPDNQPAGSHLKVALALGSGSARGLAHIGVIDALEAQGVRIDIVCGTSIGALVGAVYATGHLPHFREWVQKLNNNEILRYLNLRISAGGGLAQATRLMDFFRENYGDPDIGALNAHFGCVATNLNTGQELWLREGKLWDAVRASMALPGLLTPTRSGRHHVVDGGLVNPVPVSLCRAMGADVIIAVNLNGDIVGRHGARKINPDASLEKPEEPPPPPAVEAGEYNLFDRLTTSLRERASPIFMEWFGKSGDEAPSLANVLAGSINIMQDRITRSRLAGEPADIVLTPQLSHIGLIEFQRAEEAIAEGHACVERMQSQIDFVMGLQ
jgi:NTE family protein